MYFCVCHLPGKAVRMVPRTNAPANISADTSSIMSPEEEKKHRDREVEKTLRKGITTSSWINVKHSPFKISSFSSVSQTEQG